MLRFYRCPTVLEALRTEENAGLYCVLIHEGSIDEDRISAFDHQSWWTNTDWVQHYMRAFVSECFGSYAIYFIGHDENDKLCLFRVSKGEINGEEFNNLVEMDPYEFYRQGYDDWEVVTEDNLLRF